MTLYAFSPNCSKQMPCRQVWLYCVAPRSGPGPRASRRCPVRLPTAALLLVLNTPQLIFVSSIARKRSSSQDHALHCASVQQIPLQYLQGLPPVARVGLVRQSPSAFHTAKISPQSTTVARQSSKRANT